MTHMTSIEVYDTPSGLGGSHTVSIIEDRGDTARVRIWYGRATHTGWQPWPEWDGAELTVPKSSLTNKRRMTIRNGGR